MANPVNMGEEVVGSIDSFGKILSNSELESINENLNVISAGIENYVKATQKVVNSFNDQAIVQSFYVSGKFGNNQKERLSKIVSALQRYWNVISNGEDSMIAQTKKYVTRAIENNDNVTPIPGGNLDFTPNVFYEGDQNTEVLTQNSHLNNVQTQLQDYITNEYVDIPREDIAEINNGGVK